MVLFGADALDKYQNIKTEKPEISSSAFKEGGHFIIRDKDIHLFIEAGEIGKHGGGAPGHNDTFSFELFYKNRLIIVDPGTYSYFADKDLRNFLRSVKSHNTFFIDDEPLSEIEGLFNVKEDLTKPKVLEWLNNNEEVVFSAQHYAYTRLVDPVIIKRTFHYFKERKQIKIKDEFFGGTKHKASANIHFHPDVEIIKISKYEFAAAAGEVKLKFSFFCSSEFFSAKIDEAFFSESYGRLEKTKKLSFFFKENFPAFIITEINLE